MLLKPGVDISRLNREIRRALNSLDRIYREIGQELVITCTYGDNHMPGSLHYGNDSVDIRRPTPGKVKLVFEKIKKQLGVAFDVVLKPDHIHVEHDPKG